MVFVVCEAEIDTIINDVKILLQNIDRDGDPEPSARIADIFEQEVRWVADWRKTMREGQFPGRVLLINYEMFRQDNQAYFEALLAFYDIPFETFDWGQIEAAPEKGALHYRSGETNEWERVLTPSQISRANKIMAAAGLDPDSLES